MWTAAGPCRCEAVAVPLRSSMRGAGATRCAAALHDLNCFLSHTLHFAAGSQVLVQPSEKLLPGLHPAPLTWLLKCTSSAASLLLLIVQVLVQRFEGLLDRILRQEAWAAAQGDSDRATEAR